MRRKHEYLIQRVDHNFFLGWAVKTKRAGRRYAKYFSDKPGGKRAALRRARGYREGLLNEMPPPVKIKRRYIRNTTGVIGVSLARERSRQGKVLWRYVAQWPRRDGTKGTAKFSVQLYGKHEARRRAVAARHRGLAELMASY